MELNFLAKILKYPVYLWNFDGHHWYLGSLNIFVYKNMFYNLSNFITPWFHQKFQNLENCGYFFETSKIFNF